MASPARSPEGKASEGHARSALPGLRNLRGGEARAGPARSPTHGAPRVPVPRLRARKSTASARAVSGGAGNSTRAPTPRGPTTPSRNPGIALAVLTAATLAFPPGAFAASHREAPITALDHKADITDFFAFVSYDKPDNVTFILDVDPLLEPANGPNYFPFDPNILYVIKIDNDHDAIEDVWFELRFTTEIRAPGVFTGYVERALLGIAAPGNSPPPVVPGTRVVPPAITALDGPGSEGLSLRQKYTVTLARRGPLGYSAEANRPGRNSPDVALPSNVGPRTMPDYASLARQALYRVDHGVSVFGGDRGYLLDRPRRGLRLAEFPSHRLQRARRACRTPRMPTTPATSPAMPSPVST